jgi:hypothetical protein
LTVTGLPTDTHGDFIADTVEDKDKDYWSEASLQGLLGFS